MKRVARRHAVLRHADDRSADDVDHGHDHAGDAVALHELHGAVHGAVHLAFHLHVRAAALGFLHVDHAGAKVRVDRHLLARHGIQSKAGSHFSHALRAFGNHQELNDGQNEEHHRAHDEVAAEREVAERENDFARVRLKQNQTGRRDVEADAKERRKEQHRREDREFQRGLHVHGHHQHQEGERQIGADERVHQRRGQRHDHQRDDDHQKSHHRNIVVPGDALDDAAGFASKTHWVLSLPVRPVR